jgi:hypothetical protein
LTANEHETVFPPASVAVQLTVVVPGGTQEPEGGVHATVVPGQLSEAFARKVITAQGDPGGVPTITPGGQVIAGGCVSVTVIVNEQVFTDTELQVTVVAPTGKKEPDAGEHVTAPQAPVVVGAG